VEEEQLLFITTVPITRRSTLFRSGTHEAGLRGKRWRGQRVVETSEAGITFCRWSRNCSRERMQQPKRLDGEQLIPADTRNTCVRAWHDYCHTGK
jgi:hypothetical protein